MLLAYRLIILSRFYMPPYYGRLVITSETTFYILELILLYYYHNAAMFRLYTFFTVKLLSYFSFLFNFHLKIHSNKVSTVSTRLPPYLRQLK